MKTLVIFTSYYPYNLYETYLENEIGYLANAFDNIHIISNESDLSIKRATPPNVNSYSIPYELSTSDKILSFFQIFNSEFWLEVKFVREQYRQRVTFQIINTILQSLYKISKLQKIVPKLIPGIFGKEDVTMYSFWANDKAVALAGFKKYYPKIKAITRAHRWDVYFDRNEAGYLPLRKFMAENLDRIYFISDHAKNYFIEKTGMKKNSFLVSRLGVIAFQSPIRKDNPEEYHLVSCSYVEARKRVDLIVKALDLVDDRYRIKWTHLGSGVLMDELISLVREVQKRKKNIIFNLKGMLPPEEVKKFYEQHYVDLFINVSESEGVPVSIMESFSASIPVIATDADGTSEIVVHNVNGWLTAPNIIPSDLAAIIQRYISLPDETKAALRLNARKMFSEKYDEKKNYTDFVTSLAAIK